MTLKKRENGLYQIKSMKDLKEAAQMLEDRTAEIREIEQAMEEEYGYSTARTEAVCLKQSLDMYMDDKNVKKLEMGDYRYTLIRGERKSWNADKLRAIVGKAMFLKISNVTPDPQKIDDMVRQGKLDDKVIGKALDFTPIKAHTKRFENSEAKGDTEAERVKDAMS